MVLVVPHFLGAAGFGELAFAFAYVGFFQLAGSLGTSAYMTREIARDHTLLGSLTVNAFVLKFVAATVLSFLAIGLAVVLDFDELVVKLVVIGCAGMYFFLWNEVFAGALNGLQRMGKMSAWATITVYVSSIAGILVLARGGDVITYAIVLAVTGTITVIANGVMVLPLVRGHWRLDAVVWKRLVVGGAADAAADLQPDLQHARRATPGRADVDDDRRVVRAGVPVGGDPDLHRRCGDGVPLPRDVPARQAPGSRVRRPRRTERSSSRCWRPRRPPSGWRSWRRT